MEKDLHTSKASHMSLPVDTGLEFHLKKSDVGHDCKPGDKYMIEVPSIVTSIDGDAVRFLQRGAIEVSPEGEEQKEEMQKMPLGRLRDKIGTVKPGEEYK